MRALGRALAVSAVMWLVAAAAVEETSPGPSDGHQQQRRHLDMQSILDPTGMVSHFGETLGQAGRVLGLRIADSVADLVSSAFGHAPTRTSAPSHLMRPAWTRGDPGVVPVGGPYYQQQLRQPTPPTPPSVLGGILRLLGLDSSKLGAIALNGVIFLAQLISSSIVGRPGAATHARSGGEGKDEGSTEEGDVHADAEDPDDGEEPTGTPLSWMLDNPAIKDSTALRDAQAPGLSERLIAEIQRRFPRPGGRRSRSAAGGFAPGAGTGAPGGSPRRPGQQAGQNAADTSCIQLLVCKAGPFLDGMQRSLQPALRAGAPSGSPSGPGAKGDPGNPTHGGQQGAGQQAAEEVAEERWLSMTPVQRMFAHMPSAEEVLDRADTCAQRFPNCKVSY